jgi:hypothetical protein
MKIVQRRLTAAFVKTQAPGRDCDGGGLYLQVAPTDGGFCRSWLFCYQRKSHRAICIELGGRNENGEHFAAIQSSINFTDDLTRQSIGWVITLTNRLEDSHSDQHLS